MFYNVSLQNQQHSPDICGLSNVKPQENAAGHSNGAPVSPAAPGAGLVQQRSQEMAVDHEIPYFLR